MKKYVLLLSLLGSCCLFAQEPHSHAFGRKIVFPDIPGYKTLKCDLHIHTVFSDGSVWPNIRVEEAMLDSLDAVSMTDHIEYQPHLSDIPHPDRNRSYEVAVQAAKDKPLLIIRGSEITRSMPPGHANAIFLEDVNKLKIDDPIEVFREANRQGAFVFWNHPNWTAQAPDGIAQLTDMHKQLIEEGLLHGIEVVNDVTYSDEALQIALDHNLTIMGTSDIHGLVDWQYKVPQGGHRPLTLVFAKEKSIESIQEALKERRTVAWFNNLLIGRAEYLRPLIEASLVVESATYQGKSSVISVMIENRSEVDFILDNEGPYTFHANSDLVTIKAHDTTRLDVKTLQRLTSFTMDFEVLNALTAPNTHPKLRVEVSVTP